MFQWDEMVINMKTIAKTITIRNLTTTTINAWFIRMGHFLKPALLQSGISDSPEQKRKDAVANNSEYHFMCNC